MAAYKVLDLDDIVNAVREELKIQVGDSVSIARIKRDINMVYLQEVVPFSRWKWLEGYATVAVPQVYGDGTASAVQNSATVTLSTNPSVGLGSFKNKRFSIIGQAEVYTVLSHTAGSATIVLDRGFNNSTNTTLGYQIWSDNVALPTDCRETVEVWHDFHAEPMQGYGLQDFRKLQNQSIKTASRPLIYYTGDFVDPSASDPETESDRYRALWVHPSIYSGITNLHVSYVKQVDALEAGGDEPVMPVEDRIVLVYGALARAWRRERNPEEANVNYQLYNERLARMAGKVEDTMDKPSFAPESVYIASKRAGRSTVARGRFSGGSGGAGGSAGTVTFLKDVTIDGANLTGDVTADPGVEIDGRDLSVDGAALDAHIASTGAHGVSGDIVGTGGVQTITGAKIFQAIVVASAGVSGNVTGDLTGNVTGNVTGNLTGNATGNVNITGKLQSTTTQEASVTGVNQQIPFPASPVVLNTQVFLTSVGTIGSASDVASADGTEFWYFNDVGSSITLLHNSGDAVNSIRCPDSVDLVLHIHQAAKLVYDGSRWVVTATSATRTAATVTNTASGNVSSTDVQSAINELQGDIDAINALANGKIYLGNGSGAAVEVTPTGDVTIDNTGVTAIATGVIVNTDVNASAAIAYSKLASMSTGQVLLGNAGTPTATALSGDITVGATGTTAIGSGKVTNAMLAGSIDLTSKVTGALPAANGGTGQSSFTTGDVLYASGASAISKLGIGSSGQVLTVSGGAPAWAAASGGGSGINYVQASGGNYNAETDASGWTTYADAAATPVDLTGGSPTATWTRSTSSPLRGTGSFLFTAGTLGDGSAYTITPDRADIKAGAMQFIYMDVESTGTLSEGDYTIWVYDVANSALIQPAGYKIPGLVSGVARTLSNISFQLPTNGTTFRVAIHQAVSSPAGNLKVDNISVGPASRVYGAPITDAKAYTPTVVGLGTLGNVNVYYARQGDRVRIWGTFSVGTTTASQITIGLPTGLVIDQTKTGSAEYFVCGQIATTKGTATPAYPANANGPWALYMRSSTTTVQVARNSGSGQWSAMAGTDVLASGDFVTIEMELPILGWSSSVEMSSSTDTRVVAGQTVSGSAQTLGTSGTDATATFAAAARDTHAAFSGNAYIVAVPGDYWVDAGNCFSANGTGKREIRLQKSTNAGSTWSDFAIQDQPGNASNATSVRVGKLVQFNAADQVRVVLNQTSGGSLATVSDGSQNYFSIFRLSGPSAVAASESINVRYTTVTGTTLGAGSNVTIPYDTKVWDSHGAFNGATGTFTAPVSGKYRVTASMSTASVALSTSQDVTLNLYDNSGSFYSRLGRVRGAAQTTSWLVGGSDEISLLAGQTCTVRGFSDAATTVSTTAGLNYICIEKVGN